MKYKYSYQELRLISITLKELVLKMLNSAGSGHTGGALGMSDVFAVLYGNVANITPQNATLKRRDYIFLSNGHICPILYATLSYFHFIEEEELYTLRKLHSKLQGHPHVGSIRGVENSGGPLGQGISQAVGLAAALKRDKRNNQVYCIVGDGECEEGQVWESLLFAHKEELDNLIIIVDRNHIQIDGTTDDVLKFDNLAQKFTSFGCDITQIDGNNVEHIQLALEHARSRRGKPHVIIANTIPGCGVSFMENDYKWHGKAPNDEELQVALEELGKIKNK
ncbi:MAG: transketolase [Nanoarchaeota archaeon]|nr:transketolase [Nanoarchaeota archaeon]